MERKNYHHLFDSAASFLLVTGSINQSTPPDIIPTKVNGSLLFVFSDYLIFNFPGSSLHNIISK